MKNKIWREKCYRTQLTEHYAETVEKFLNEKIREKNKSKQTKWVIDEEKQNITSLDNF